MIPESDDIAYNCQEFPKHIGGYSSTNRYSLPYPDYFGGVVAFEPMTFRKVNGFSNDYWGVPGLGKNKNIILKFLIDMNS